LHACCCDKLGHPAPPYADAWVMVRVCFCTPPPHTAEQADHADQPLTAQLMAHGCVLQVCDCVKDGQAVPPKAAYTTTERVDTRTPEPHVLEHPDHADHEVTAQLTGQGCMLQF